MTGIDTVVYRPSKAIAFFLSIGLMILYAPKSWVFVVAGYIFYRILFYERGRIYKFGINRIYLLGLISLLPYVLSFLVTYDFRDVDTEGFNLGHYMRNMDYYHSVNLWVKEHADSIFAWKAGLVFSPLYGVFLYLLNVEMDRKEIKQNDVNGLKITVRELNKVDEDIEIIFNLAVVVLLFLHNALLALIYLAYMFVIKDKIAAVCDLIFLTLLLIVAATKIDIQSVVKMPGALLTYSSEHGLLATALKIPEWRFMSILLPVFIAHNIVRLIGREKLNADKEVVNLNNGVFLGYNNSHQPVIIADKELNQHALILGTTGSGKTTTIFNVVNSALSRNLPLIFLDGKGSTDLVKKLRTLSKKYGRTFRVFSLEPSGIAEINAYNPFYSGNPTEWKNRVMALFQASEGRGQEHFALKEENYLNIVCQILYKAGYSVDLKLLVHFIEQPELLLQTAETVDQILANKLKLMMIEAEKDETTLQGDIIKQLDLFLYSNYGNLFDTLNKPTITIKDAIKNGEVVLFLFNASSYALDTYKVAKMVINDINSSFAELANEQGFTKCYCVFDEFASYASSNLSETLTLQRSNGLHAIVGTQGLATVSLKSNETKRVAEELTSCCNTYIVQKINHQEDVELMAKLMGTMKTFETTAQVDNNAGGTTGGGTVKNVDAFNVNPQDIRELQQGEGYICRKAANLPPAKIKFNYII